MEFFDIDRTAHKISIIPFSLDEIAKRRRHIDQLDLKTLRESPHHPWHHYRWNDKTTEMIELWYRRFLTVILYHPSEHLIPHPAVDKIWETHLTHNTLIYEADCQAIFGGLLIHDPSDHEMPIDQMDLWYERTNQRLRQIFKEDYSVLPPPRDKIT